MNIYCCLYWKLKKNKNIPKVHTFKHRDKEINLSCKLTNEIQKILKNQNTIH